MVDETTPSETPIDEVPPEPPPVGTLQAEAEELLRMLERNSAMPQDVVNQVNRIAALARLAPELVPTPKEAAA
jgi:hypothetical protein